MNSPAKPVPSTALIDEFGVADDQQITAVGKLPQPHYSRRLDLAASDICAAVGWLVFIYYRGGCIGVVDIAAVARPLFYLDAQFQMRYLAWRN